MCRQARNIHFKWNLQIFQIHKMDVVGLSLALSRKKILLFICFRLKDLSRNLDLEVNLPNIYVYIDNKDVHILFPAGTWRKYNVASTLMQRHDVASTLRRRYIFVMCLPGYESEQESSFTRLYLRPAKTQISLRIRAVLSESSHGTLCGVFRRTAKTLIRLHEC